MSENPIVQIHLGRADDLAIRLDRAANAYLDTALRTQDLLVAAGAPLSVPSQLAEISGRLGGARAELRRVVTELRDMEAGVRDRSGDVRIDRSVHDSPFVDDVAGVQAAAEAIDAFGRRDMVALLRINARWSTEGAYAAAFAGQLRPDGVLDALDRYQQVRGRVGVDAGARQEMNAMVSLFQTLGVASRLPTPAISIGQIADRLDDGKPGRPELLLPLTLLFEPDAEWSTDFLIAASRRFLLPANRDVLERGSEDRYVFTAENTDGRVLLMRRIAEDPRASSAVLAKHLAELLPSKLDYRDDGRALGAMLVSGTGPDASLGRARAQEVIDYVALHKDLQPGAHAALGQVAAPYLGSFRDIGFKGVPIDDPLPQLNPQHADLFLRYAAEHLDARYDLRVEVLEWSNRMFSSMAPGGSAAASLQVIGNVNGNVSVARDHGALAVAASVDREAEDEKKVVNNVLSFLFEPFAPPGPVIGLPLERLIDSRFSEEKAANIYARSSTRQFAVHGEVIATMFLHRLWQQRDRNHLFEDHQPPASLLTGDGRLKTYGEMTSDSERFAMRRWVNELEAAGTVPLGSLDRGYADAGLGI